MVSCFYRDFSYGFTPLKLGVHDYSGKRVELVPIRTYLQGLCYKLKFLDPKPFDPANSLQFIISSNISKGMDKLEKVSVTIASSNTWQGIIGNAWPYNKDHLQIIGRLSTEVISFQLADLKENMYVNRVGEIDFDKCMNEHYTLAESQICASIFDPRSNQ